MTKLCVIAGRHPAIRSSRKETNMKYLIGLIMVILSVFSTGAMAANDPFTAKKGDTSWGISKHVCGNGAKWQALGLPERLMAGVTYTIDPNRCAARSVKAKAATKTAHAVAVKRCAPCTLPHFNRNAFRNSGRDPVVALESHGYSKAVAEELVAKYRNHSCTDYMIGKNERFIMMLGKTLDLVGRINYVGKPEKAKLCVASTGERAYIPDTCANWAMKRPEDAKPHGTAMLSRPKAAAVATVPSPVAAVAEEPLYAVPATLRKKTEGRCHTTETNVGIYEWQNALAKTDDVGVWGEVSCWNQFKDKPEYSWMVGVFGSYAPGESRLSAYGWDDRLLAGQLGLQRTTLNGNGLLQQWQAKLRFGYEWQKGGNPDVGYDVKQNNVMFGGYAEWWDTFNKQGDRYGLVSSWWTALSSHRTSSAVGWTDNAQSRTTLELLGFYETRIGGPESKWKVRPLGGVAYTAWDEQSWFRLIGEIRYDDFLMFGPYWNIPIGGVSKAYPGVGSSALNTTAFFVRAELGDIERRQEQKLRVAAWCKDHGVKDCPVKVGDEKPFVALTPDQTGAGAGWDVSHDLDRQIAALGTSQKTSVQKATVGHGFNVLDGFDRMDE